MIEDEARRLMMIDRYIYLTGTGKISIVQPFKLRRKRFISNGKSTSFWRVI